MIPNFLTIQYCLKICSRAVRAAALAAVCFFALVLIALPAAAQVSYQYTGNPYQFFSCGPSSPGPGTAGCFNDPAPGNPLTSYKATDFISATLTVTTALPPNLNLQDVTALPGFKLTMSDGEQTLISGTPSGQFFTAKVSTDANGQIIAPWAVAIDVGNANDSEIVTQNAPSLGGVIDQAILACCDPTVHGNLALNQNDPGTWAPGTGLPSTATYGAVTRVVQQGEFPSEDFDITVGDLGQTSAPYTLYTTVGIQAAYPKIVAVTAANQAGLTSGAWSEAATAEGGARGIAFRNFQNITSGPLTVKLNAVLNGEIDNAPFGLPDGPAYVGAAIHVLDATSFANVLNVTGKTAGQVLLDGYPLATALSPSAEISSFPGKSLANGTVFLTDGPFGTISTPVSTSLFTVAPQQVITVAFDAATATFLGGGNGTIGGDNVYFLDTLSPATNFFTDANGNPVTGITPVDTPPTASLPVTPATLTLTPSTSTGLVGSTQTVTATATDSTGAPVSNTIVKFTISSGPDAGTLGAAVTNSSGQATFSYAGTHGEGTDLIVASVAAVTSNTVQVSWTLAATPELIYISDSQNNRIRKVGTTGAIGTVAGTGSPGFSGDQGAATSAQVQIPYGVALDTFGNLYIADTQNNRVRKVTVAGIITTVAGTGAAVFSGDNGPATSAGLNHPTGVALDTSGNLYIADEYNNRIRKVNTSGTITTVAGNGNVGNGGDSGPAVSAQLYYPAGIAVDALGNFYIADSNNQRIRKVNTAGTITTVAGNGNTGYNCNNGTATSVGLHNPTGVAVDGSGNLYIADYGNQCVRKVDTSGNITAVAGTGTASYSGDGGPATSAALNYPTGVAVDSFGDLYIADYSNNRIREVNTSGIITTIAGKGPAGYNGDSTPATSAELYQPTGVAVAPPPAP